MKSINDIHIGDNLKGNEIAWCPCCDRGHFNTCIIGVEHRGKSTSIRVDECQVCRAVITTAQEFAEALDMLGETEPILKTHKTGFSLIKGGKRERD